MNQIRRSIGIYSMFQRVLLNRAAKSESECESESKLKSVGVGPFGRGRSRSRLNFADYDFGWHAWWREDGLRIWQVDFTGCLHTYANMIVRLMFYHFYQFDI